MIKRALFLALLLAPTALAQAPAPEDPAPLIDEARTAYAAGELGTARRALERATIAVASRQGQAIRAILPQPFEGWTVIDSDVGAISLAVYGGGLSVDRTYTSADGTDVRIEIMADSAMVEQMAAMYGDAQMAQMMGMKTETIAGQPAVIDPTSGQITIIVDKRTSFSITGSASQDVRRSYAENIDFAAFMAIK
jgi:hypothetical protein